MTATTGLGPALGPDGDAPRPGGPSRDPIDAKFRPPSVRPGIVPRTELVDRLLASPFAPVVCVVAPPGYGKTTMLSQWAAQQRDTAWVSLDRRDNDASVLLYNTAVALDQIEAVDPSVFRALASPGASTAAGAVARFGAALSSRTASGRPCLRPRRAPRQPGVPRRRRRARRSHARGIATGRRHPRYTAIADGAAALAARDGGGRDRRSRHGRARGGRSVRRRRASRSTEPIWRGWSDEPRGGPPGCTSRHWPSVPAGTATTPGSRSPVITGSWPTTCARSSSPASTPGMVTFLTRTAVLDRLSGPLCDAVLGCDGVGAGPGGVGVVEPAARAARPASACGTATTTSSATSCARSSLVIEPALVPVLHAGRRRGSKPTASRRRPSITRRRPVTPIGSRGWSPCSPNPPTREAGLETARRWFSWFAERGLIEAYPQVAVLGAEVEALSGHPAAAELWADVAGRGRYEGSLPDGSPLDGWMAYLDALVCRHGVDQMRADAERARHLLAPGSPLSGRGAPSGGHQPLAAGDADAADAILAHAVDVATYAGANAVGGDGPGRARRDRDRTGRLERGRESCRRKRWRWWRPATSTTT